MTQRDELIERMSHLLATPAEGLLADYLHEGGPFAGATFDVFGDNLADQLNAHDLLAVSMRDVAIRPRAVRQILVAPPMCRRAPAGWTRFRVDAPAPIG